MMTKKKNLFAAILPATVLSAIVLVGSLTAEATGSRFVDADTNGLCDNRPADRPACNAEHEQGCYSHKHEAHPHRGHGHGRCNHVQP